MASKCFKFDVSSSKQPIIHYSQHIVKPYLSLLQMNPNVFRVIFSFASRDFVHDFEDEIMSQPMLESILMSL